MDRIVDVDGKLSFKPLKASRGIEQRFKAATQGTSAFSSIRMKQRLELFRPIRARFIDESSRYDEKSVSRLFRPFVLQQGGQRSHLAGSEGIVDVIEGVHLCSILIECTLLVITLSEFEAFEGGWGGLSRGSPYR